MKMTKIDNAVSVKMRTGMRLQNLNRYMPNAITSTAAISHPLPKNNIPDSTTAAKNDTLM